MTQAKVAALPQDEDAVRHHSFNARELSDRVVRASATARNSNRLSAGSLAQLRLAHLRLHGREDDMALLRSKLRQLGAKNTNKEGSGADGEGGGAKGAALPEIIFIKGLSGVGKSALVAAGVKAPAEKMGMVFAGGKFDMNKSSAVPLSAFSEAMTSLANFVAVHENAQAIQEGIREEFGEDDLVLLSQIMPGCGELLGMDRNVISESSSPSSGQTGKEMISRQQYAIVRLLKIICANIKGVVLFIDDLQWADTATLDLVNSISLDDGIPSLLLVGAYREDEVPDTHPLALRIREKEQMGIELTTVRIGNLSADNVKSLVAEALGMEGDEDRVDALAATVHKKTEGNAFFVLMFLRSLHDEQLLQFNWGATKWIWDDAVVESKLVTENVATVLLNKLKRLEATSQSIIKIASCLGASFSAAIVATVHGSFAATSGDDETDSVFTVSRSSKEFEEEGLWEIDEGTCRFSHDKVQSAAFDLIPPEERDSFRSHVGDVLTKKLDPQTLDGMLFEVISLRNCSPPRSVEERKALAGLNLEAGLRACSKTSFDAAVVYFRAGRELLGDNAWEEDRDTIVALCSEEANACFVLGDLERMTCLTDEVLSKDIPIKLKFKAVETKILALWAAGKALESIDTAFEFRRQLGLKVFKNKPVSTATVLIEYMKTNRALGARTAEDIASLPPIQDERVAMGQRILELLLYPVYQGQQSMYPLISFLLVRTTIKYGLSASSIDGLGSFGLILCGAFGKFQRGRDLVTACDMILAERPDMKRMQPRNIFFAQASVYHWTAPLQDTLTPLLNGYQLGVELGDIENAGLNLVARCNHLFYSARPLDGLEQELETNVSVLQQMNQEPSKLLASSHLVTVRSLRGVDSNDAELNTGAILQRCLDMKAMGIHGMAVTAQLDILVINGEWDAALRVLLDCGDIRVATFGFIQCVRFTFSEALIYLKAAQKASGWLERRKWTKRAKKAIAIIASYTKKGNVNTVHLLHLLQAESAALSGKKAQAEERYKAAISVAAKNGFVQDRALCHEVAGAYYTAKGDSYWSKYHLDCAEKNYSDWGASAKVRSLVEKRRAIGGE